MTLTKKHLIYVLVLLVVTITTYALWPEAKPHKPVKSFAIWFVDAKTGKDTSTVVFRLDYDTISPFKKWDKPLYYLPVNKTDSIKRAGKTDSVVVNPMFYATRDPLLIIHDFDKDYK